MPVVRTEYQSGETAEALLQVDLGGTLSYSLELDGDEVTADSDGTCVLTDGTTTVASGTADQGPPATMAISAAELTDYLGEQLEAHWTLALGGVTRTYRQRVLVVRWAPPCPVSTTSLLSGRPVLRRYLQGTGQSSMDDWILRAWQELDRWLRRQGNRVHLCVSDSDLYDLTDAWAVVAFLEDLALNADPGGSIRLALEDARSRLRDLRRETVLTYDSDDTDGVVDDTRPAQGPIYLVSGSGWRGAL